MAPAPYTPNRVSVGTLGAAASNMVLGMAVRTVMDCAIARVVSHEIHAVLRRPRKGGATFCNLVGASGLIRTSWRDCLLRADFFGEPQIPLPGDTEVARLTLLHPMTPVDYTDGGAWVEWCIITRHIDIAASTEERPVHKVTLTRHGVIAVVEKGSDARLAGAPFAFASTGPIPIPGWVVTPDTIAAIEAAAAAMPVSTLFGRAVAARGE